MSKALLNTTCISDWPCHSKGYQLLNAIGKGHSGSGIIWKAQVTEGVHKGKHIAIKKLYLEKCDSTKLQEIRKNILLLNLLDHSNILSYKVCFVNKKDLWIVSDLMDAGSLEKLIKCNYPDGLKDQALIATIIKEILEGLKYLHKNNQVHRNVKAANILVSSDGSVKLSDFGVAAKLKDGKKTSTLIGSPCWMAPEVLNQDTEEGYDYKVDLWSLGITALELAQGKPPGHDLNTMQLILRTLNDEPPRLGEEGCWDESFREFLSFCLVKAPNQRKSAVELLRCCKSFFNKAKGKHYIVEKLLKGTGPLESRIDQETIDAAQAELNENDDSKPSNTLKFNFKLPEQQDHREMCRLVDQFKIQLGRSHLPKLETEFILRRTLTVGTPSLNDFEFNESMTDLEPRSADFANKFESRQKLKRTIYRYNTVKLDSCTGDKLDTLGEEEI